MSFTLYLTVSLLLDIHYSVITLNSSFYLLSCIPSVTFLICSLDVSPQLYIIQILVSLLFLLGLMVIYTLTFPIDILTTFYLTIYILCFGVFPFLLYVYSVIYCSPPLVLVYLYFDSADPYTEKGNESQYVFTPLFVDISSGFRNPRIQKNYGSDLLYDSSYLHDDCYGNGIIMAFLFTTLSSLENWYSCFLYIWSFIR